jgi:hypothetical protein
MANGRRYSLNKPMMWRFLSRSSVLAICLLSSVMLNGCSTESGDAALTSKVVFELVDWHISGFWVINCPVAWVRIANYNTVPIKNITFEYDTFDVDGKFLDRGTYTIPEGEVEPGGVKNFIEQYLGLVSLPSDKLSVKLVSVTGS